MASSPGASSETPVVIPAPRISRARADALAFMDRFTAQHSAPTAGRSVRRTCRRIPSLSGSLFEDCPTGRSCPPREPYSLFLSLANQRKATGPEPSGSG